MAKFEIFFYRPDKLPNQSVVPELCFTLKGQPYQEWVADRQLEREVKIDKLKKEILAKPVRNKHFIEDNWQ